MWKIIFNPYRVVNVFLGSLPRVPVTPFPAPAAIIIKTPMGSALLSLFRPQLFGGQGRDRDLQIRPAAADAVSARQIETAGWLLC